MTHTKGPWQASCNDKITYLIKSGRDEIARISHSTFGSSQDEINARILASSPELLETVIRMTALLESIERETGYVTSVTQRDAKQLIKKAKGENE